MKVLRRDLHIGVFCLLVLMFLALTACGTQPDNSVAPNAVLPLGTPAATNDQATVSVAQTQRKTNTDNQAAATAQIVRANAQATLDSANATVSAAQTQDQNNANIIVAQIAATAAIERANALATLSSAGATQSAALTQDAIRQTEMADQATTDAQGVVDQQNKDAIAASTGTAAANFVATQTESAVATSQWYNDQSRQRDAQRQGPISFLWIWCLPVFIVVFAGLCLWGFWRWLKIRQKRQRLALQVVEDLQTPRETNGPQVKFIQPVSDNVESGYQLTKPDDQVNRWLTEVKSKLLNSDKKDEDDNGSK
jgi:hypothetical protein